MTKPEGTDGKENAIRHENSVSLMGSIAILHEEMMKMEQKTAIPRSVHR